ncbi:hypothetical protein [Streptomyces sp. NPDC056796]|uniref:hypothetical protein n=1 Tax=Streptomyces sp. NPDC056796 TaxID=3345947 RepID=UPI0036852580
MSSKAIDWRNCECGQKRGFTRQDQARKALGQVQAKRTRRADLGGSRRGLKIEHRAYECEAGYFHLTSKNRKEAGNREVTA